MNKSSNTSTKSAKVFKVFKVWVGDELVSMTIDEFRLHIARKNGRTEARGALLSFSSVALCTRSAKSSVALPSLSFVSIA